MTDSERMRALERVVEAALVVVDTRGTGDINETAAHCSLRAALVELDELDRRVALTAPDV